MKQYSIITTKIYCNMDYNRQGDVKTYVIHLKTLEMKLEINYDPQHAVINVIFFLIINISVNKKVVSAAINSQACYIPLLLISIITQNLNL